MNILLIFFALPIATIIISIALQKILKCPPLVAGIIFSIFLIVTFIINNLSFLIATIIYTIISFITALIVCISCRLIKRLNCNEDSNLECCCRCNNNDDNDNCSNINANGVTARINVIPNSNTNGRTGCICGSFRRR